MRFIFLGRRFPLLWKIRVGQLWKVLLDSVTMVPFGERCKFYCPSIFLHACHRIRVKFSQIFQAHTSHLPLKLVASKVPPEKKLRGGVEFVEKIPKSASGKILRRLLRKQEQQKSRLWLPELSALLSVKLIDVVGSESSLEGASLIDYPEWDHSPCSAQWNF